jgi:hypothetical protein
VGHNRVRLPLRLESKLFESDLLRLCAVASHFGEANGCRLSSLHAIANGCAPLPALPRHAVCCSVHAHMLRYHIHWERGECVGMNSQHSRPPLSGSRIAVVYACVHLLQQFVSGEPSCLDKLVCPARLCQAMYRKIYFDTVMAMLFLSKWMPALHGLDEGSLAPRDPHANIRLEYMGVTASSNLTRVRDTCREYCFHPPSHHQQTMYEQATARVFHHRIAGPNPGVDLCMDAAPVGTMAANVYVAVAASGVGKCPLWTLRQPTCALLQHSQGAHCIGNASATCMSAIAAVAWHCWCCTGSLKFALSVNCNGKAAD